MKKMCKNKSGSALISPDKHKTLQERRLFFAFFLEVAYDQGKKGVIFSLEGLGARARQKKRVLTIVSDPFFLL
jgi:hypothetical protein